MTCSPCPQARALESLAFREDVKDGKDKENSKN